MSIKNRGKKKILFIATLGRTGGVYRYIEYLTEAFKDKFDITVAAGEGGSELTAWAEEQGIRSFSLEHLGRELGLGVLPTFSDIQTLFDLLRHIRDEKYDIVHLNSSKMGLIGAIAARIANTPKIVFTAHGWVFNEPKSIRGKRLLWIFISRLAGRFQDQIICVSDYDLSQAVRKKIAPPRKLSIVRNGIDIKKIMYLPRAKPRLEIEKKVKADKKTIIAGTIANFYPTKDLKTMIRSASSIKNPNFKLVIIGGEGPQPSEELERLISNLNLEDKVYLLGYVENAVSYLKAFDIYLVSSVKEGLPFSVLEAMATGLPIISTPVGGLKETLFGDQEKPAGIEFAPGKHKDLAKKINKISNDKDLAETLSQNAKSRVSEFFSYEQMIQKTRWVWELE